jgi:hypothetical protein
VTAAELGQTNDPIALIPGDLGSISHTQAALHAYGDLLHLAGEGLQRINTSDGWSGAAADAFHAVFHGQPGKWLQAGDAFHDAAAALDSYASVLGWAQIQAGNAISLWNSGQANQQAARDTLASGRSQLAGAGDTAAIAVGKARDLAPPKPGFWSQVGDDLGSFFSGAGHVAEQVGETALTDLASVGNAMAHDPGSVAEIAGGLGLAILGAGGEIGGVALDATGIGALVGVPVNVVSAGAIAGGLGLASVGLSNVLGDAAGPDRVNMSSDGTGGGGSGGDGGPDSTGHTQPTGTPDPNAKPSGQTTKIGKDQDASVKRSLQRENESADILAQKGYDVEQNPQVPGLKNPDYRIEGEIFDNVAPSTGSPRNIASRIQEKVDEGQTDRIVLNLADSPVDISKLNAQLHDWPIDKLKEVLVIDSQGNLIHLYP